MGKITIVVVALAALLIYKLGSDFLQKEEEFTGPFPDFFWGPKSLESQKEDTKIYPFKINVDEKVLTDLKDKLKSELNSGRFRAPLEGIGFEYGFNTDHLKTVVSYWLNKYDWRSREKLLNQYPQFKTKIAGIDIHFQHVKSKNAGKYKKTVPLLVIHGWPGSIVEHQKLIPLLTDPKDSDINFEVVAPSLPGYGFSEGAVRPGMGPAEMGQVFTKLMKRLGHEKFYVHGGDWGSLIVKDMGKIYPNNVIGVHSVMCMDMSPLASLKQFIGTMIPSLYYTPEELKMLPNMSTAFEFLIRESGYFHIQATKPDTVGVGLSLSPSALAAYILEKFSTWTNADYMTLKDGGLTKKFTLDELLDNIMVYWVTNTATTSVRLYSEAFSRRQFGYKFDSVKVPVPTGCVTPGHESFASQPRAIAEAGYKNIVTYTYSPEGGHFFGFEEPDFLAKDIVKFVSIVESGSKSGSS